MNASNQHQLGISVVDSLIALVVVCVGMLGVASLHLGLSQASEVLRQRGEATRWAQASVERLRMDPAAALDDASMVSASTLYRQRTTREGSALRVEVQWQDRAGRTQASALTTQLSPIDTAALALQTFAPAPAPFTAHARHPSIPPGAERSPSGRSRLSDPGLAHAYHVDNASGTVAERCHNKRGNAAAADLDCTPTVAYLVSGFIRFGAGVPAGGLALDPASPLSIRPTSAGRVPAALDCSARQRIVWRNPASGHTLALDAATPPPQDQAVPVERFIAYTCVALPVDDGSASPPAWSGVLELNPDGWTIGAGPTQFQVQRIGHATPPVSSSLDQQNFLVVGAGTIGPP